MSKKTNLIMVSAVVATSVLLSGCGMFGGEKTADFAFQPPVLRPLIGSDKEEIIKISRKIDTIVY